MRLPDEPTTPEQWQIIGWAFIAVLVFIGVVGIYVSFRAPVENVDLLIQVRFRSLVALGVAALLFMAIRLIKNYFN